MIISRALCQAEFALETLSDNLISQYRPTARRLLSVSEIYKFWAKKTFAIQYNDASLKLIDFSNSDMTVIFFETTKPLIKFVYSLKSGAALSNGQKIEISTDEKILLNGLYNMLQGTRAYISTLYNGGDYSTKRVCMACGISTDDVEACPVCGGGKNQIVKWIDL